MKKITLGSLFDGSGGFPLGGVLCGIEPKWKSEIEPFAIAVTNKHFPNVKHYGDVSKIDGGEVEPVDIITFGSPCQDLSVAGKRAGLENGERSNLFYQAIRIIKEMRSKTNGEYPRFIVWENVPGAFSSNKGQDFRSVLEAVCSVKEPEVHIPEPQGGKWTYAGEIVGDGYSVAWRTIDAQYFGVPQRRRRIYLVADFGSECAGQILFESESVSRDTSESSDTREGTAGGAETCARATGFDGYNGSVTGEVETTLGVNCGMSSGRNGVVLNDQGGGKSACNVSKNQAPTLTCTHGGEPAVYCMTTGSYTDVEKEKSPTLMARDYKDPNVINAPSYGVGRDAFNQGTNAKFKPSFEEELEPPLLAKGPGAVVEPYGFDPSASRDVGRYVLKNKGNTVLNGTCPSYHNGVVGADYSVRRLTPTECAKLQGFPSDWCCNLGIAEPMEEEIEFWTEVFETYRLTTGSAIKPKTRSQIISYIKDPYSDAAEYKLWGNGVALPCVKYVLGAIAKLYEKEA